MVIPPRPFVSFVVTMHIGSEGNAYFASYFAFLKVNIKLALTFRTSVV